MKKKNPGRGSHIKKTLILLALTLLLFQCKNNWENNCVKGRLVNLAGLDGCGWVIKLDNGSTLEPVNLGDFDIKLVNDRPVCVSYHAAKGYLSICMVGDIVEIEHIK